MLIDTHCHLDASEFDADRDEVIARARASGVRGIIIPAVAPENFETVADLARSTDGCAYALGIHPMYLDRVGDDALERLHDCVRAAIGDPRFVAIGEIGLDFFVPGLDRTRQERFFAAQLAIARAFDLPVLMHVRRAQDTVLAHLRRAPPVGGIAHAFNGSLQQAEAFLRLGCVLGFGGAMTFQRALRIRALVTALPATAHVLETDAPDIPPHWCVGRRNAPAELDPIARVFAQLRGCSLAEALETTAANAHRVMPRLATALRG